MDGQAPPPAASSFSSLTRRLLELGFKATMRGKRNQKSSDASDAERHNEALAGPLQAAAEQSHSVSRHQPQFDLNTEKGAARAVSGAGETGSPVVRLHQSHHSSSGRGMLCQTLYEAAGGVTGEGKQESDNWPPSYYLRGGETSKRLPTTFIDKSNTGQTIVPAAAAAIGACAVYKDSPQHMVEEEMLEDLVLMTCVPTSLAYRLDCKCAHAFSTETLYGCIKAALIDDLIPACPLANHPDAPQRCNYLLTQKEVEHVLNRHAPPSQLPAQDRKLLCFRRGRLVDGGLGWVSERVTEAFLRKGKIAAGCIECPNGRCSYWVEPTRPLEKQRVDCPKCLMAFCSLCKRPYHFRCSCDEVMTITKQWLEWQQHGRAPYLTKMAREDSSYQAALDVFKSRRAAHVQEVRTAEQNWGLLVADENYKASRCKRCPHCNRVIERVDGCDTMVCGQNAHGGNIQNGCGQAFDWNDALLYVADIGEKRSIVPFQEVPPAEIARVEHQIMDGTPVKCDVCSAKIMGPLAMCINCPSFSCCIRCQNKHTRGHVLRLYMDGTGGNGHA